MARRFHPSKEIHAVIDAAVRSGRWQWERNGGRNPIKGELRCPFGARGGCVVRVASTPRNPEGHARKLARLLRHCPHEGSDRRVGSGRS